MIFHQQRDTIAQELCNAYVGKEENNIQIVTFGNTPGGSGYHYLTRRLLQKVVRSLRNNYRKTDNGKYEPQWLRCRCREIPDYLAIAYSPAV